MEESFKITMPQLLMLNHAAHHNQKRIDRLVKTDRRSDSTYDGPVFKNKKLDDLSSDELTAYLHSGVT